MDDLFGGVVYAGIDTDRYKYPIGSGRVTFGNQQSFMKAVKASFVEIKTKKFTKKVNRQACWCLCSCASFVSLLQVQIDPYLEDSLCTVCGRVVGPYFCREFKCFKYFCRSCWQWQHAQEGFLSHRPLTRTSKSSNIRQQWRPVLSSKAVSLSLSLCLSVWLGHAQSAWPVFCFVHLTFFALNHFYYKFLLRVPLVCLD